MVLGIVSGLGNRKQLKGEELKSVAVDSVVKFATSEIQSQKLKNGEVNECVQLQADVLRVYSQVVSGYKYTLELRVSAAAKKDEMCANKINKSLVEFKPEICDVEVWSRPWKAPRPMEMLRSTCLKIDD